MLKNSYENFFVNFANKTRLAIIVALKDGPLNVSEISEKINEEQSKVSHNLRKLSECQILNYEKKGKERFYSLNKNTVIPMLKIVESHVCGYCKLNCSKDKKCREK